jgi:hypothetical protein
VVETSTPMPGSDLESHRSVLFPFRTTAHLVYGAFLRC